MSGPIVAGDGTPAVVVATDDGDLELLDLIASLSLHWKLLVFGPVLVGLTTLGLSFLVPNVYTSRTLFLPPQQQQSAASAAMAQLGALSSLAGTTAGVRTPGDQYLALLQSQTVADRLVDAFELQKVYRTDYRFEARLKLARNSRISLGRKDGLLSIEVDDRDPHRAAAIANRYVEELRNLSAGLVLTEAQQRRLFMEQQLKQTRERLVAAQQAVQASGFNPSAIKADARASTEAYARALAEVTSAEVRLHALRVRFADNSPEVQQSLQTLQSLRGQLSRIEAGLAPEQDNADYISKLREFKYQETLFDLFARQYELARVDEGKDGALIQVIDVAQPAEWKSKPQRATIAVVGGLLTALTLVAYLTFVHLLRRGRHYPTFRERVAALRGQ